MVVSVTSVTVKAGQMEECLRLWREGVAPMLEDLPSARRASILVEPETHKLLSLVWYESQSAAQAVLDDGQFQEAVAKIASTLVMETLVREILDERIVI